ncbi:hypothetical protein Fot_28074 [Forsythia ovata]|uniref:Uncharacterized protein n=1 Tax=Forsythia ovata TaxID=205694 RepID=A0ABD1TND3_9LAMI
MGVVGPSGAENPMEEEDVSPRIRKVTLRLTSDEMDRVFVEIFSWLSSLPKIGLARLATKNIPPVLKGKLLIKSKRRFYLDLASRRRFYLDLTSRLEKKINHILQPLWILDGPRWSPPCRPKTCRSWCRNPEAGRSSKQSLRDEDDLEILEEEGLARKTKKPLTAFSKSLQNQLVEGVETFTAHEAVDPSVPEEKDYDHLVHVTKILEGRANDISSEVLGMLPNHIQRATVTIDSFWTDSWVAYSAKLSVGAKLIAAKALAAGSIVTMN